MHVHDVLLQRRTIHLFEPGELPQGALDRSLVAAHHAPCHKHTWPWRFVVLGQQTRAAITERVVQLKCAKRSGDKDVAERVRRKRMRAAVTVAVLQVLDADTHRRHEDYAAVACAIQNMQLSLWAEGVGSKWSTSALEDPEVLDILGVDPSKQALRGFVFAGVPAKTPVVPRPDVDPFISQMP